jgi:hypothetical protein
VNLILREFDNRRFEGVARRATPSKRRFFVGVGAAHPHEKPLVELTLILICGIPGKSKLTDH